MILVTGASGKTGRAVIGKLAARGASVRAWVHHAGQEDRARQIGAANVISGDLRDGERLQEACAHIEAIYHICPNMSPDEVEIGHDLLQAAKRAGVKHFVYHSVFHSQVQSMPHHWKKLLVEEQIFSSGVNFTILQPTAYLQNLLPYWRRINAEGIYEVPYAVHTRLSMVDLEDVAEAAAVVVNNPDYFGGIFELVGTPPYTQTEVAQIIGSRIQKQVHAIQGSRAAWEEKARQNGTSDYSVHTLLNMFDYYEKFGMQGNSHALKMIIKHTPADLPDFIDRLIQTKSQKTED